MKQILLLTDNGLLYNKFINLLVSSFPDYLDLFDFKKSRQSNIVKNYESGIEELEEIDVKDNICELIARYSLIISLHCKPLFPKELISQVRCVNVHPGYNPQNRGWYPQVFAIINHTIVGATIHEMDEKVDNGYIICRESVPIYANDTSKEVYERVLEKEIVLLKQNFIDIVNGTYQVILPENIGTFHTRKEFLELCKLDLSEVSTVGEVIDKLRGLTHGDYTNAYFVDEDGNKIYVKISLTL